MEEAELHHHPGPHKLQNAEKKKSLVPLHWPENVFPVKDQMFQIQSAIGPNPATEEACSYPEHSRAKKNLTEQAFE